MGKIRWIDKMRNEEILKRVREKRKKVRKILADMTAPIFRCS